MTRKLLKYLIVTLGCFLAAGLTYCGKPEQISSNPTSTAWSKIAAPRPPQTDSQKTTVVSRGLKRENLGGDKFPVSAKIISSTQTSLPPIGSVDSPRIANVGQSAVLGNVPPSPGELIPTYNSPSDFGASNTSPTTSYNVPSSLNTLVGLSTGGGNVTAKTISSVPATISNPVPSIGGGTVGLTNIQGSGATNQPASAMNNPVVNAPLPNTAASSNQASTTSMALRSGTDSSSANTIPFSGTLPPPSGGTTSPRMATIPTGNIPNPQPGLTTIALPIVSGGSGDGSPPKGASSTESSTAGAPPPPPPPGGADNEGSNSASAKKTGGGTDGEAGAGEDALPRVITGDEENQGGEKPPIIVAAHVPNLPVGGIAPDPTMGDEEELYPGQASYVPLINLPLVEANIQVAPEPDSKAGPCEEKLIVSGKLYANNSGVLYSENVLGWDITFVDEEKGKITSVPIFKDFENKAYYYTMSWTPSYGSWSYKAAPTWGVYISPPKKTVGTVFNSNLSIVSRITGAEQNNIPNNEVYDCPLTPCVDDFAKQDTNMKALSYYTAPPSIFSGVNTRVTASILDNSSFVNTNSMFTSKSLATSTNVWTTSNASTGILSQLGTGAKCLLLRSNP